MITVTIRQTDKQTCYATLSSINKNVPAILLSDAGLIVKRGPTKTTVLYESPALAETVHVYHSINLTYLLTPWSRVLLEKLTGFAANQEILRIL